MSNALCYCSLTLSIIVGATSRRGVCTFIRAHRPRFNNAFGLKWAPTPAHTSIRSILSGLDAAGALPQSGARTAYREKREAAEAIMSAQCEVTMKNAPGARLSVVERYLTMRVSSASWRRAA
jgi:hypothetical protein